MKNIRLIFKFIIIGALSFNPILYKVQSQIVPSTFQGVAPLLVHFEATCSPIQFHHSLFTWNFGDFNAPNWGTDHTSQNIAQGPVTAHLFEDPGTFQVILYQKNEDGSNVSDTINITVLNPEAVFESPLTVCVNPENDADFSFAPTGSLFISTDSLNTITQFATQGNRILLKRGGVWSVNAPLNWPQSIGPVVIGAYGAGLNPDSMGIFENNPHIIVNSGSFLPLNFKQHWTVMDLTLSDPSLQNRAFGGAESFHHWLFLRLKVDGFQVPIGWSTWNDPQGNTHADHMGIVSCVFENAAVNVGYIGSERLMVLGSIFRNASQSHVLRVWQCYKGIIAHNQISGSSINTNTGRHALKFHGPSETQVASTEWNHLNKRTQYSVISDNVFGTSGPWPVMVAPQDNSSDERISHIIFERNQYFSDFGSSSTLSLPPSDIFTFIGTNLTIRNNIIDASSNDPYFTGILIKKNSVAPIPESIEIYHNTIYKYADPNGQIWYGVAVLDTCGTIIIRNNLVEFPFVCAGHFSVFNISPNTEYTNNVLNSTITFEDPAHIDPLQRSFRLHPNSLSAIDMGYSVPSVHNDFDGTPRPMGLGYDIGAFEFSTTIGVQGNNPISKTILFPNPSSGMVYVHSDSNVQTIEIFDASGKLTDTYHNTNSLNLSYLKSGVYIVKTTLFNHSQLISKLFIIH